VLCCVVLRFLGLACFVVVLSCGCLVLSCRVVSCLVLSCNVLSCLGVSCLVLPCLIFFLGVVLWLPSPVLSCLVMPCRILSCLTFSSPFVFARSSCVRFIWLYKKNVFLILSFQTFGIQLSKWDGTNTPSHGRSCLAPLLSGFATFVTSIRNCQAKFL
jgi:hypothetical protein